MREYALVTTLDENLPKLTDYLKAYYDRLGYITIILDEKSNKKIEFPVLYICWIKKDFNYEAK